MHQIHRYVESMDVVRPVPHNDYNNHLVMLTVFMAEWSIGCSFDFNKVTYCLKHNHAMLGSLFPAKSLIFTSISVLVACVARSSARMVLHCSDVTMNAIASQVTGVWIVCSVVCSGARQRKHQSSALLAFVRGIHRSRVDSPHKGQ